MRHFLFAFVFLGLMGCLSGVAGCKKQDPTQKAPQDVTAAPHIERIPPDTSPPEDPVRHFEDAAKALSYIIEHTAPSILGFGEYHQQDRTVGTRSSLKRFTEELLPVMKDSLSDLVVETWISSGNCGKQEAAVTSDVAEVTQRPEATEDETVALIQKAAKLGIRPRVLKMECDDYEKLQDDGGVDYLALLTLIGKRLGESAKTALKERMNQGSATPPKGIAIFGGAIHNDADPSEMWADVSFGGALREVSPRYVEVDLYVPEFIRNSSIAKKEPWFPMFQRHVSSEKVTLIEQGPRAFIIIFKENVVVK